MRRGSLTWVTQLADKHGVPAALPAWQGGGSFWPALPPLGSWIRQKK